MGVQAQHLVMYGIKLTQEEAHARFPSAPDEDDISVLVIGDCKRTGYRITRLANTSVVVRKTSFVERLMDEERRKDEGEKECNFTT